jgi:hypothetical protein
MISLMGTVLSFHTARFYNDFPKVQQETDYKFITVRIHFSQ